MKSIRIITIVLCYALIFSFNVYAVELTNYTGYDYVYSDSQGVIILSNSELQVIPLRSFVKMTSISQSDYLGFKSSNGQPLILFIPVTYGNNITYTMRIADIGTAIEYDENGNISTATSTMELGSFVKLYQASEFNAIYNFYSGDNGMNGTEFYNSYTYSSNHTVNHGTNTPTTAFPNTTINPNYTLNDAFVSDGLTVDKLINAIDEALQNNQNIISLTDKIQIIIDYGSDYNQIDSNLIGNLGNAEDQLSNAEDALQNKSQNLVNKVASQWTANKGVASSFLTTITPAASAIGTVTDDFFEAIPEEIKNAVITIMLIVFIGWLIGRIEG